MASAIWLGGVKLGGLTWLGFAATIGLTANLYSDKPLPAYLIDSGYQLVHLVTMGRILAVWRSPRPCGKASRGLSPCRMPGKWTPSVRNLPNLFCIVR